MDNDVLANSSKLDHALQKAKLYHSSCTDSSSDTRELSNGTDSDATVKLQLNGHDRFSERKMSYFTRLQPNQHHTNTPLNDTVGVYSFSLKPEEHQPSGTCNFSRIDNAQLTLDFSQQTVDTTNMGAAHVEDTLPYFKSVSHSRNGKLWLFAVNYNVLRIMSGMGGLAYSN